MTAISQTEKHIVDSSVPAVPLNVRYWG